ncbi:cytosine permease [Leucobacter sp. gxy201]|uniref:purine-cytosine permease family protein n=1 Tax=Leucobacter sp. gxy201 TaxID=2957200 RepID=UPI003DA136C9
MDFALEAERGRAPLPARLRLWGFWEYTWANSALAIATWGFLIGGSLAGIVGVKDGILAIVLGNVVGVLLTSLAVCISSGKYGVEQYTFLRSIFGPNGSRVIYILAIVLLTVGWLVVLGTMFGRSVDSAVAVIGDRAPEPGAWYIPLITIAAIALTAFIVAKGPTSIKVFNTVVAPALFIVMGVMVYLYLRDYSALELWELPALEQLTPSQSLNFMIAVEINIAAGFSWWPYIGNLSRITKTERIAFWPNLIGICFAACVGEVVGLVGAIVYGNADPTHWMTKLGGVWLSVIVLLFIAFANVTSMANILYTAIAGLRQAFLRHLERFGWEKLTYMFCVIPVVAMFALPGLYDGFITFMVWTAALYSALSGIMIVDYFWLRKSHVPLADLFDTTPNSSYYYWKGFNPAAIIALVVGAIASIATFNPQTLAHGLFFETTTASVFSLVIAGLVYALVNPLFVKKLGWGAYDRRPIAHAAA